jgi:hypothetical protein
MKIFLQISPSSGVEPQMRRVKILILGLFLRVYVSYLYILYLCMYIYMCIYMCIYIRIHPYSYTHVCIHSYTDKGYEIAFRYKQVNSIFMSTSYRGFGCR